MADFTKARELLSRFKGDRYLYGLNVLDRAGHIANFAGEKALLVTDKFSGSEGYISAVRDALIAAKVTILSEIDGALPNSPRQDLQRITNAIKEENPGLVVSFGGGSTIDAAKAAIALAVLGGDVEDYFGTGLVTAALGRSDANLIPHMAIQTASSSGSHLTKYSNITDVATGQKKLIVDEAIIPDYAVFDYAVTLGAPKFLIADGALDGISHSLEVLYGAAAKADYGDIETICLQGIRLIVNHLPSAIQDRKEPQDFEALGLATDLGGYAIMVGGTNGAHLTSFSLVGIMSHGRACGLLNPYYTVFFAPAIEQPLIKLAAIYKEAGYIDGDIEGLRGRALGVAVAEAMIAFTKNVGNPTTLNQIPGYSTDLIGKALLAAKNPQLKMKLENMPISMTPAMVDEYMTPILKAAETGNLSLIKNV